MLNIICINILKILHCFKVTSYVKFQFSILSIFFQILLFKSPAISIVYRFGKEEGRIHEAYIGKLVLGFVSYISSYL